jgi:ornithine cyclodeaminase/alanine dehydrogenase-like protein (mu-crystallin family)
MARWPKRGDLLLAIESGAIDRSHIMADLYELASGKKRGRIHQDDITLFKSVGCALEDLVTAQLIYKSFSHKSIEIERREAT